MKNIIPVFAIIIGLASVFPGAVSACALPINGCTGQFKEVDLQYGDHGENVKDLQWFLQNEHLFTGEIGGNFLGITKAAVASFQMQQGISPVNGRFGPVTRARANAILRGNSPVPNLPVVPADDKGAQIAALQVLIAKLQLQIAALKAVAH